MSTEPLTGISNTAVYVAAGRAVGAREPDALARNPDYLAGPLLGDAWMSLQEHPCVRAVDQSYEDSMRDIEVVRHVRATTVRSRFVDRALLRAVAAGAKQLVIFGAGLDSRACRFRTQLASVDIFELDNPATQAFKRRRMAAVIGRIPENVAYVSVDLLKNDVVTLLRSFGYTASKRTVFVLEGVTMYLSERAFHSILGIVALCPAGSSIVFDFVSREFVQMLKRADFQSAFMSQKLNRFSRLIENEPWNFGISPGTECRLLEAFRLEVLRVMDVTAPEALQQYLTRVDGTIVGADAVDLEFPDGAGIGNLSTRSIRYGSRLSRDRARKRSQLLSPQLVEAIVR